MSFAPPTSVRLPPIDIDTLEDPFTPSVQLLLSMRVAEPVAMLTELPVDLRLHPTSHVPVETIRAPEDWIVLLEAMSTDRPAFMLMAPLATILLPPAMLISEVPACSCKLPAVTVALVPICMEPFVAMLI